MSLPFQIGTVTPFGIHLALIGANLQSLFSLPASSFLYFDFSIAMIAHHVLNRFQS